jgi:hypothetical protein
MRFQLKASMAAGLTLWLQAAFMAQLQTDTTGRLKRVPGVFQRHLGVLGNRMQVSGKELTTYSGEFMDAAGARSPARVLYQTPGLVRLDGFKPGQAVLSFDGDRALGVVSRDDELLLETFVMDMPEGMLASVQRSAAVRLLGLGFGPDPRKTPRYTGPRFDIFEVTTRVRSRSDRLIRSKLYYFDSQTGLLQSTRYYDRSRPAPVKLETRFSDWRYIDGSAYPGRIDHFEGGRRVFSFIAAAITAAPRVEPAQFR